MPLVVQAAPATDIEDTVTKSIHHSTRGVKEAFVIPTSLDISESDSKGEDEPCSLHILPSPQCRRLPWVSPGLVESPLDDRDAGGMRRTNN